MSSEAKAQILGMIRQRANSTPSAVEFEMAYQARVAIDRIRFAIRATEIVGTHSEALREANMQLLDALVRLEASERSFQQKCRGRFCVDPSNSNAGQNRSEHRDSQD